MPNHFLLTGNELVADWPEPKFDYQFPPDGPSDSLLQSAYEDHEEKIYDYKHRPRYTCTKELLAMLKEGERYQEGKDFETHPCSCDRRMDNHTDCGKPGKNRTPQCFIAMPVYTGEAVEKGEEKETPFIAFLNSTDSEYYEEDSPRFWNMRKLMQMLETGQHDGDCVSMPATCCICVLRNMLEDYEDYCESKGDFRYKRKNSLLQKLQLVNASLKQQLEKH